MLELINQKYMHFLFIIAKKPNNISTLSKKADLTLSVTSTMISRWAREGIIKKEISDQGKGREIIVYITDYGKKQISLLKEIEKNYKEFKESHVLVNLTEDAQIDNTHKEIEKEVINGSGKNEGRIETDIRRSEKGSDSGKKPGNKKRS